MFKVWLTIAVTLLSLIGGVIGIIMGQVGAGIGLLVLSGLFGVTIFIALAHQFRVVVAPNAVHTVQGSDGRISYGTAGSNNPADIDADGNDIKFHGNSYYSWPEWWPKVGVTVVEMPLSVFSLSLDNYVAYDQARVPFVVDIMAFFRVALPDIASERIEDFRQLETQLLSILQGAARTLLASENVEKIMMERQIFGDTFTKDVAEQLREWGVVTVKNIELMDIRDPADESSNVIGNIQAKEQSRIEKESRTEVAENIKEAEIAETTAKKEADVAIQLAEKAVGEKEAEKDKVVGVANEQAKQEILAQASTTAEKDMAVKKINEVRQAEINKEVQIVKAAEVKEVSIVKAEGDKQEMVLKAEGIKSDLTLKSEGKLAEQQNEALGVLAIGESDAKAKLLLNMADVDPEITLSNAIGSNEGYQNYLNTEKAINAQRDVGVEAAKAMSDGDLKVIVNSGDANSGVNNMMDLFSSKGGTALGAMIDAGMNTDGGKALIDKFIGASEVVDVDDGVDVPK